MAKVTGSDIIVQALRWEGVDVVFGIAGDHILHLLDVMFDEPFRMVDTRHESAAIHAADSYSRILRRPSVVLSTTPGHANTIPALANAMHSEAPIVNIAGSAESGNLGRGAMQEFDQVGVAKPVTKGAWEVPSVERIPEYVSLAFRTALSGRCGPVHLTIPHDLQAAEVDEEVLKRYYPQEYGSPRRVSGDKEQVRRAVDLLCAAERPMIFAGSGACATVFPSDMLRLVENLRAPFFSVDSGRALIPDSHELSFGLGYLPLNAASRFIDRADVVLLLGKRLDYTMGFGGTPPFHPDVKQILVDPSPAEIGRGRAVSVGILGDVGSVISQLADASIGRRCASRVSWLSLLREAHLGWLDSLESLAVVESPIHPMLVSSALRKFMDDDTHITFDGGDFCHFLRASIPIEKPFRFHNVSSFGMIGVGVAYALGAQVALPDVLTVLATGDGSFGFNGMELDTMVRHNLPVKIVLGNNAIWGIDWQIQKGLFGRPVWTNLLPTRWDKVAEGLGAKGERVAEPQDLLPALERAFAYDGPALVDVEVAPVISPVAESAISRKLGSHG